MDPETNRTWYIFSDESKFNVYGNDVQRFFGDKVECDCFPKLLQKIQKKTLHAFINRVK